MSAQNRLVTLARQLLAPSNCEQCCAQSGEAQCAQPSAGSHPGLVVAAEVAAALREGRPVVALESTIISHGMPYPQNLQTALTVEDAVRRGGAVPATIAIIGGACCVGLSRDQLEHIARSGPAVTKVSRRDLPAVIAAAADGATTVSATMLLAARAGIRVFVTGGIGGVHRGGESSMDVSADLTELARTPVAVICAGAKSVLDIPRTLEFLETRGVPVAAYGVDELPAFFTRASGCAAPCRVDTPAEAAAMIKASLDLRLGCGMVLAVPIPREHEAEGAAVEGAIAEALAEAGARGIKGAAVTPFLLERIRSSTGGRSLTANIALVTHNAGVGAAVARELAQLEASGAAGAGGGGAAS
ncbi:MAG: pseudouridine-5'-phosphate glycosidase [Monoraphidium minutum]|nr:MAG: pseudouridine-5'-phosphate glycosidase [Monoraphidium minutum]